MTTATRRRSLAGCKFREVARSRPWRVPPSIASARAAEACRAITQAADGATTVTATTVAMSRNAFRTIPRRKNMARKYQRWTLESLSLSLLMACAPERTDSVAEDEFLPKSRTGSVTEEVFVPNASCTMPSTWDPQIGMPSASALAQLAPEGKLRVGILTGNAAIGAFANGKFSGTSVDVVCRLAAKLGLQLDMTTNSSPAALVAGVQNGFVDIGFALGPSGSPVTSAHAYIGIQQVYLVGINTTIQTIADVDQPGVTIAVQAGNSTDFYLTSNIHFATILRFPTANEGFLAVANGTAQASPSGLAAVTTFVNANKTTVRLLPGVLFEVRAGPIMKPGNNSDAICYLTDYIEAAKLPAPGQTIGLLQAAIDRSNDPLGRLVPPSLPGCAPSANCHDVTVVADASCHGSASVNAGSDDPDSDLAGCTQSPEGPYDLGATAVTLTCTDTEGLTSTCNATVTVVDTTPPVIACPADQMLECTAESAIASFVPAVTDNCGTASVQCTPPSGTTFSEDAAPTAVSCVAVDAAGNQAACGFRIAVQDTLPPVVTPKLEGNGFSATLWPPNHSYYTVTLTDCIQSVADQCDGALPVGGTILRVTSDESESGVGEDDDGTCDDIVLVDSTTVKLRAERSDESDGRVYSIFAVISDDDGNQASLTCKVQVPPQHKKAAVEGTATYCVGQGCESVPGHDPRCKQNGEDDGNRSDDGHEVDATIRTRVRPRTEAE